MFLNVITHIKNSVIISFIYKLFKEMFKMSSAAAQKASTKFFQIFSTFAVVDPIQPNLPKTEESRPNPTQTNPTHGSTQPMDNSGLVVTCRLPPNDVPRRGICYGDVAICLSVCVSVTLI